MQKETEKSRNIFLVGLLTANVRSCISIKWIFHSMHYSQCQAFIRLNPELSVPKFSCNFTLLTWSAGTFWKWHYQATTNCNIQYIDSVIASELKMLWRHTVSVLDQTVERFSLIKNDDYFSLPDKTHSGSNSLKIFCKISKCLIPKEFKF